MGAGARYRKGCEGLRESDLDRGDVQDGHFAGAVLEAERPENLLIDRPGAEVDARAGGGQAGASDVDGAGLAGVERALLHGVGVGEQRHGNARAGGACAELDHAHGPGHCYGTAVGRDEFDVDPDAAQEGCAGWNRVAGEGRAEGHGKRLAAAGGACVQCQCGRHETARILGGPCGEGGWCAPWRVEANERMLDATAGNVGERRDRAGIQLWHVTGRASDTGARRGGRPVLRQRGLGEEAGAGHLMAGAAEDGRFQETVGARPVRWRRTGIVKGAAHRGAEVDDESAIAFGRVSDGGMTSDAADSVVAAVPWGVACDAARTSLVAPRRGDAREQGRENGRGCAGTVARLGPLLVLRLMTGAAGGGAGIAGDSGRDWRAREKRERGEN